MSEPFRVRAVPAPAPAVVELDDADLEQVVGGLDRIFVPVPGVPRG